MNQDSPANPASVKRVVAASFLATAIEWYDFFLYGTAAAVIFPKLFFPDVNPFAATLASFGTFSIGFIARPIGGVVFGHYGDRIGRKSVLITTLMMVGFSTFLIGLLPTYAAVGVLAPALLVVLRFVQGLGVGGQWAGAVLLVVEHGPAGKRGYHASWVQAGAPAGLLLATAVFALFSQMPEEAFLAWGWRVPFLLGVLLTGVGLYLRMKVLETPVFAKAQESQPKQEMPLLEVLRKQPRNVVLAMGARMAENAFYYFFTVFALTYATDTLGMPRQVVLNGLLVGAAVQFGANLFFGALSDRVGRRPVYLGGAIFLAAFIYPFFLLVELRTPAAIWTGIIVGMLGHAVMYGPQAAFLSELFGTRVRYTGASLGYQLASPLSGGLAPIIAAVLLKWSGGEPWPVALYLIGMAAITIVCVSLAAETSQRDLMDDKESA